MAAAPCGTYLREAKDAAHLLDLVAAEGKITEVHEKEGGVLHGRLRDLVVAERQIFELLQASEAGDGPQLI